MAVLVEVNNIAHPQGFSSFRCRDRRVDGETVVMIEAFRLGPGRERFLAAGHECFLKVGDRLGAIGIAHGNDASLAGVVAEKLNIAELKWLKFAGLAEEVIL